MSLLPLEPKPVKDKFCSPLLCIHWASDTGGIKVRRNARLTEESRIVFMILPPVSGRYGSGPQRGWCGATKGTHERYPLGPQVSIPAITSHQLSVIPPHKSNRIHLRDDCAPLARGTHGGMDRFLRVVTDEAHGREVHPTSHPRPLSRGGAGRKTRKGQRWLSRISLIDCPNVREDCMYVELRFLRDRKKLNCEVQRLEA